jgi:hypothetical protein
MLPLVARAYQAGGLLARAIRRQGERQHHNALSRSAWRSFWCGVHGVFEDAKRPPPMSQDAEHWHNLAVQHHSARVEAQAELMRLKEKHIAMSRELTALKRGAGTGRGQPQSAKLPVSGSTPARASTPNPEDDA